MDSKLSNKHILIVIGSLLSHSELRDALVRRGAKVTTTKNLVSAYDLVARKSFDGAVVDYGLQNEAFDFCTELQALNIPYISASTPHRLQGLEARERDADATAARLANLIEMELETIYDDELPDYVPSDGIPAEIRAI